LLSFLRPVIEPAWDEVETIRRAIEILRDELALRVLTCRKLADLGRRSSSNFSMSEPSAAGL
jgi:hypothetical protein